MTKERIAILLQNAIICLEEYGYKDRQLQNDIGITEEEYKKIMEN